MKLEMITFFSFVLITSSILVVLLKNPLHSVLALVSSFLSASLLIFLFDNEFLALFFIIIYLGAIAILFLFVVMMLDIKIRDLQITKLYFPAGIVIGSVVFFEIWGVFKSFFSDFTNVSEKNHISYTNWYDLTDSLIDINSISQLFYNHYVLQILIAGLILYVASIGVAFLTISSAHQQKADSKKNQSIFRQLSRKNIL